MPDSDIEDIFNECSQPPSRRSGGVTNSKDIRADRKARRAKADLDDAYLRAVERDPNAPDKVADKAWELAMNGNMDAIKFLTARISGNVPNKTELTGADGGPIVMSDKPVEHMTEDELRSITG